MSILTKTIRLMVNENNQQNLVSSQSFLISKQTNFFKSLKIIQFTGELLLINKNNVQWRFYFYSGDLIYGTGGEHSVRRWQRNLLTYIPQMASDVNYLDKQLQSFSFKSINPYWEYELLHFWLSQEKIKREEVKRMILGILEEIFFDLNQTNEINFLFKKEVNIPFSKQIFSLDPQPIIISAYEQWQNWKKLKLGQYSANIVPVFHSPEALKEDINPKTYESLSQLINGRNTIRDISLKLQKDLIQLGRLITSYLQKDYIDLISITDLPCPLIFNSSQYIPTEYLRVPLIACVNDDLNICKLMENIILTVGFKFLEINDPFEAIGQILAHKPDLIFLDLEMPNTNTYDICNTLKKLSLFSETPIIILTENDGMIKRVRTKIVGCADFMAKPIEQEKVLKAIAKHLPLYQQFNSKIDTIYL